MAYVHPGGTTQDVTAAVLRQGTRFAAVASYAAAVAVAIALLAPILPNQLSRQAAGVPSDPQPVVYTMEAGGSLAGIAASHGIALARLFALNPELSPLSAEKGETLVVGLR